MKILKISPTGDFDPGDPFFREAQYAVLNGCGIRRSIALDLKGHGTIEVGSKEIKDIKQLVHKLSAGLLKAN